MNPVVSMMKISITKNTLLQFAQGNSTNQKLQESIFSPTQIKLKNKKIFRASKNKTSFQRTVRTSNIYATIVNRFVESVCGHEQNRFVCRVEYAYNNKGFVVCEARTMKPMLHGTFDSFCGLEFNLWGLRSTF